MKNLPIKPNKLDPIEPENEMQIRTIRQTVDINADSQPIFIEDGF